MIHPFRYDRHRYTLLLWSARFNRQCNEQRDLVIFVIRHACLSIVDSQSTGIRVWAQHHRVSNHTRFTLVARRSNRVKTLLAMHRMYDDFVPP